MSTVFLVGFMGSGKTSVGLELARRRGCSFVDLDRRLEERFACSIREIFEGWGEDVFREAELEELERIAQQGCTVIATGGGVYCSEAGRDLIRRSGGVSVFLDAPWEEILRRVGAADRDRPLWTSPEAARELFERRRPLYRSADLIFELTTEDTPDSAAARLLSMLEEAGCVT